MRRNRRRRLCGVGSTVQAAAERRNNSNGRKSHIENVDAEHGDASVPEKNRLQQQRHKQRRKRQPTQKESKQAIEDQMNVTRPKRDMDQGSHEKGGGEDGCRCEPQIIGFPQADADAGGGQHNPGSKHRR
jgi:hypothetical protein